MSLDVCLILKGHKKSEFGSGIFVRKDGAKREITRAEWDEQFPGYEPVVAMSGDDEQVYSANITHNLNRMAGEVKLPDSEITLYQCLWRPEEIGITHASQLIEPLQAGFDFLRDNPELLRQFNPENGWGSYDALLVFVDRYLQACRKYPGAEVSVSR